jgi:glutathione S-transferase
MSVFVSLKEKGLDFELTTVDLSNGENLTEQFAAKSQTKRLPALLHNGFSLSESSAIAEYLEEIFPENRLFPLESKARAKARQVQAWLRSDLMPIRVERSTEVVFYGKRFAPLTAAAQESANKLFSAAESMLPLGAENLFGSWSIADVDLSLMLNRLALHGDFVPKRLEQYASRQWARDSIQEWVNQVRPEQ